MTTLVAAVLAVGATLLQVGAISTVAVDATVAPLLPIALLAAWGTMRRPGEVWPGLLLVSLILGITSGQRTGWYLLALLPTGIALLALAALPTASLRLRANQPAFLGRVARAMTAAAVGAWAYLALLLVAGGDIATIPDRGVQLVVAALWTGALAAIVALPLWPLRARPRGLFA